MTKDSAAGRALTTDSIVRGATHQTSCELSGEVVILNFDSGVYFGLDGVGARIWELLGEPRSIGAIHAILLAEYEVGSAACLNDLLALLRELRGVGLIEVLDGAAP